MTPLLCHTRVSRDGDRLSGCAGQEAIARAQAGCCGTEQPGEGAEQWQLSYGTAQASACRAGEWWQELLGCASVRITCCQTRLGDIKAPS